MTQTRRTAAAFLGAVLILSAAACGKSGYPQPADGSKSFAWEAVDAKMAGPCIAFTATLSGQHRYFDGVRLELEGLSGPDDCPGCPFVPGEVTEFSAKDAGYNPDTGNIAFTYCPRPAQAYRWRLAGISVYSRLPHAVMNDRMLINSEAAPEAEPGEAAEASATPSAPPPSPDE